MREAYFHYANPEHLLVDKRGAAVSGFADACIHADRLVRTMIAAHNDEDWRGWELRVTDDLGEEIFVLPFAFILGKLH